MLVIVYLCSCQRTEYGKTSTPKSKKETSVKSAKTSKKSPNKHTNTNNTSIVTDPGDHSKELFSIIDLAGRNHWEEAESRASALYALNPNDPSIQRVYKWVKTEGPKRREKALEGEIREMTVSGDTRFNPTIKSILTDPKTQGLPPRSDLREAIEQINATPLIPPTFGKIATNRIPQMESSTTSKMELVLDKKVDARMDNVTLENIIFNLGQAEGVSFVADKSIPAYQQRLSVNMTQVPLRSLLQFISRNMGVQFQVGNDLIWVIDGKDTNRIYQETRFYRLKKGFVLPAIFGPVDKTTTTTTVNNIFTVQEIEKLEPFVRDNVSDEPAIETVIKKFFTGKYQIDYERNLILARGTPDQLAVLENIIKEFDRSIKQVLIEARFITVAEATFLKLGVAWETGRSPITTGRSAKDYTGMGEDVSLGLEETWVGVLDRESLSATLTALDQSGESETLSSPRLSLLNNLPATIKDGKVQYYYEEYKVSQTILEKRSSSSLIPSGKPASIISGVTLDVLASIGNDGESILLALNPEVTEDVQLVTFATVTDRNDAGQISSSFDIKLPESRKQSLATRVTVKSGQTVVMGGVMQQEKTTFVEAVPVLSRIPILGAAFRRRMEVNKPRYLLVFVTATILSESGEYVVPSEGQP